MRIKTGKWLSAIPLLLVGSVLNPLSTDMAEHTLPRPQTALIHSKVEPPQPKVTSRSEDAAGWHKATAEITAYSPLDDRNGINGAEYGTLTSTGTEVGPGTFAVDPDKIPYGSEVVITYEDGSEERGKALDTGGAMRNADGILIDTFRETYDEAMDFGRRKATIKWRKS